jgi:hypothetical protein
MYQGTLIGRDLNDPEQERELNKRTAETIELVMRTKSGEIAKEIENLNQMTNDLENKFSSGSQ